MCEELGAMGVFDLSRRLFCGSVPSTTVYSGGEASADDGGPVNSGAVAGATCGSW